MASSTQERFFHVRSISLPSGSHPLALQFHHQLQMMKTIMTTEATTSTSYSPASSEMLQGLAKLHSCVENILSMPESQKAISRCKNEKWVAEELDGSVRFLDICDSTRDSLSTLKEQAQGLQSMVRTRRVLKETSKSKSYASSCKKSTKEMSKCLKNLKQMDRRRVIYPNDDDNSLAVRALKDLREMSITVCNSVLSSLESQVTPRSNWSLVSKTMGIKQKVVAGNDSRLSIISLCKKISDKDGDLEKVQMQLKELESGVGDLDNGLECLFQGLIRNKVALLNILTL